MQVLMKTETERVNELVANGKGSLITLEMMAKEMLRLLPQEGVIAAAVSRDPSGYEYRFHCKFSTSFTTLIPPSDLLHSLDDFSRQRILPEVIFSTRGNILPVCPITAPKPDHEFYLCEMKDKSHWMCVAMGRSYVLQNYISLPSS